MSEKTPSKADALRAMREANYSAKSSEVGKPAPRMSTPSAVRGKPIGANDMPSPETSGASESNSAGDRPTSSALIGVATGGNVTRSSGVRFPGGAPSSGGGEKLSQPIGAGVHGKAPTTVRVPLMQDEVERIAGRVASAAPETKSKKTRAPNGTFDRKAYQRNLMRKRRQAEKKS